MSSTLKKTNKRIYSYDIVRIFSALVVVMVHAISPLVTDRPYGSFEFTFGNILDSVGRASVANFLMLSGALLLNEKKDIPPKKLIRSALHIFVITLIWSFGYALFTKVMIPLYNGNDVVFKSFFKAFIKGHFHMWYLYMLVGLYLLTPILRLFVKRENMHYIVYFLVLAFSAIFLPTFIDAFIHHFTGKSDLIMSYIDKFEFNYINEFLCYYLLGWLLTNVHIPKKHRIVLYVLGILGYITTAVGSHFFMSENMRKSVFYNHDMINIAFFGIGIFVFCLYRFKKSSFERTGKFIKTLSDLTFGVYLIHGFFLIIMRSLTMGIEAQLPRTLIICVSMTVLSFVASYIISKIPVIRKLIST